MVQNIHILDKEELNERKHDLSTDDEWCLDHL